MVPQQSRFSGGSTTQVRLTIRRSEDFTNPINNMATFVPKRVFDSQNCQLCSDVDNMDMVQCDSCDRWFHYECVGVTDSVADRVWCCQFCIELQEEIQDLEKDQRQDFLIRLIRFHI